MSSEKIGLLCCGQGQLQERFKIPVNVHLDDIFSTAEPFVNKLGMVMHLKGSECHARRLVCYLQGQDHSEGTYDKI